MRPLFAILRAVVAIAIVGAVVVQLARTLSLAGDAAGFALVNFFSFFTIDSNVIAAATLGAGAVLVLVRREDPASFAVLRATATTYMATTGIVYNLLLRAIALPQGSTVPWSNEVLHVVGPLWLVLDWILAPGRRSLPWRAIGVVLVFPVVWVVYTLVRGPLAIDPRTGRSWYPYPFLDPETSPGGYLSVAVYVALIAVVIGLLAAGAVAVSRRWAGAASRASGHA